MADRAAILFFDPDGVIRFKASRGLSEEYRSAVTGHTPWQRGQRDTAPLITSDVLKDESLSAYRPVFARENIRALVFVPLALDAGVVGKFMLYYAQTHSPIPPSMESEVDRRTLYRHRSRPVFAEWVRW